MIAHTKHVLRLTAGVLLILVGLVCVILPVIPGWPLIIPGLMLLGIDSKKLRHWVDRNLVRFPRFGQLAARLGYRPEVPPTQ